MAPQYPWSPHPRVLYLPLCQQLLSSSCFLCLTPYSCPGCTGRGWVGVGEEASRTHSAAQRRRPAWWHKCAQWQVQTCSRIREQGSVCWVFRRCEAHVPFLRLWLRDEPPLSSLPALGNKSKPERNRSLPAPFQPAAPVSRLAKS